tara:strand:+ start:362 stop:841 length:480 start_codon:yes stop_codon:yes gene_type:complete
MKAVTVSILKNELRQHSQQELVEICLQLAKFKKENKELLSYVLFDSRDEDEYIRAIKEEMDEEFSNFNYDRLYFVKKSTRKTLRIIKKYIRYSKKKETEAHVLLYFCTKMKGLSSTYKRSLQMTNIYERQLAAVKKAVSTLHEDLQYDFNIEIEELEKL